MLTTSVVATTAASGAITALGAAVVLLRLALRRWTRRTATATDRRNGAVVTANGTTTPDARLATAGRIDRRIARRACCRTGDGVG